MYVFYTVIAKQEDYIGFSAPSTLSFPSQTSHRNALITTSTILDNIAEGSETLLLNIINVTTVCHFELENGVSTITIRDRESKFYD